MFANTLIRVLETDCADKKYKIKVNCDIMPVIKNILNKLVKGVIMSEKHLSAGMVLIVKKYY